jgi:soluble lytic murein transglycosylase
MILRRFHTIAPALAALVLALFWPAGAFAGDSGTERAFLAAYDAYHADSLTRLEREAARLKGYVLEPYVEFWRLELQLEDPRSNDAVRAFLQEQAGSYLAERLRADWLEALGKRADWKTFREALPQLEGPDLGIRCYAWQARLADGDQSAYEDARAMWSVPRELPEACRALAQQMIAAGRIGVDDIWERVRLLLWDGKISAARRLIAFLPAKEAPNERLLTYAAVAPRRLLAHLPRSLGSRPVREVFMFALTRLARDDPDEAAGVLGSKLGGRLPAADSRRLWAFVATEAARDHLPEALEWYAQVGDDALLTDEQLEWKVRAALRAGDWRTVHASIDAMSAAASREPAWVYWYARSLATLGDLRGAHAYFLMISDEPTFYGVLATEGLGYAIALPKRTYVPSEEEVAQASRVPGLQRALELYRLDLRTEATREWTYAIHGMNDHQLLASAELALRAGVFDRAINTADKTSRVQNYSMRYLMPFRDLFGESARACQLDEAWVLGLVRQESRFIVDAKSGAGARGLMQLMPRTARWVARKVGLRYRLSELGDARTNIALGTQYLKLVLDDLGHPVLASAAYNAGPRRAAGWCDDKPLEGAIYVESIPFRETRNYVKNVMTNTVFYAALLGQPYVPLKERLGTIPARGAEQVDGDLP